MIASLRKRHDRVSPWGPLRLAGYFLIGAAAVSPALAIHLDDADFLAQIEAVDHLMSNMHGYPGRVFGQIFHLLLRSNDLADGGLRLGGRDVELSDVGVPVLVVAGRDDVIAPLRAVRAGVPLLTGSPEVRFTTSPGGHLGVLTGRRTRDTTWPELDRALADWDAAADTPDVADGPAAAGA